MQQFAGFTIKLLKKNPFQDIVLSWHLYKLVGYHPYQKEKEIRKNIYVHVFTSFEEEEILKTYNKNYCFRPPRKQVNVAQKEGTIKIVWKGWG